MNLRDLEYLVAIADHRHFGRAAQACNVSQPTLSMQVRKLEQELGVQLVERSPRQVLLTPAGAEIVERARSVHRETNAIRDIARYARDPEAGRLRLGIFPTLGPYLLPHVVPALHARFPRLELRLVEEKTATVLARLRDGTLDAGILASPAGDDSLHEEPLFREDFVLAVPADQGIADAVEPVSTDVLAGQSVLLLEDGHCLRDHALEVCQMVGGGEHDGFRATSLETLRQMVAAGVGVTLLPNLAVRPPVTVSDDVRLLRFAEPVPHRDIAMYWRPSTALRDFLPTIAELFRQLPATLVHPAPTA